MASGAGRSALARCAQRPREWLEAVAFVREGSQQCPCGGGSGEGGAAAAGRSSEARSGGPPSAAAAAAASGAAATSGGGGRPPAGDSGAGQRRQRRGARLNLSGGGWSVGRWLPEPGAAAAGAARPNPWLAQPWRALSSGGGRGGSGGAGAAAGAAAVSRRSRGSGRSGGGSGGGGGSGSSGGSRSGGATAATADAPSGSVLDAILHRAWQVKRHSVPPPRQPRPPRAAGAGRSREGRQEAGSSASKLADYLARERDPVSGAGTTGARAAAPHRRRGQGRSCRGMSVQALWGAPLPRSPGAAPRAAAAAAARASPTTPVAPQPTPRAWPPPKARRCVLGIQLAAKCSRPGDALALSRRLRWAFRGAQAVFGAPR
jgi:hypothetical protein